VEDKDNDTEDDEITDVGEKVVADLLSRLKREAED
jgi:hypothetical protein